MMSTETCANLKADKTLGIGGDKEKDVVECMLAPPNGMRSAMSAESNS